jgi:predicted nuclease with TOPRIM domain
MSQEQNQRPQTSSATVNGNFFNVLSVSKIIGFRKTFLALIGKLREKSKEDELLIHIAEDLEQVKLESNEKSLRIAALETRTQKLEDDLKLRNDRILGLEVDIESVKTDRKNLDDLFQKLFKAYNELGSDKASYNGSNASSSKKKRRN